MSEKSYTTTAKQLPTRGNGQKPSIWQSPYTNNQPSANEIAQRFPTAKRSGSGWKIPCPAHKGEDPNCYIGDGDDGGIVAKCWSYECSWEDIMHALGLPLRGNGRDFVVAYENRDGNNRNVYRRESSTGKKIWGNGTVKGTKLLPWGELSDSVTLVLVEGEKAAQAFRNFDLSGYVAVSWRDGAKSVDKADFDLCNGYDVVCWPDADASGQAAMEMAARKAFEAGALSVRIVDVSELPAKADAADVNAETAAALIEGATTWERPSDVQPVWAQVTVKGAPLTRCPENARRAVKMLDHIYSFNEFTGDLLIDGKPIDDRQSVVVHAELAQLLPYLPTKQALTDGLMLACHERPFHPVRDYLDACKERWDGTPRLSTLGGGYFGTTNTPLQNYTAALILRGGVVRICHPGATFPYLPIIQSLEQGCGKSMALEILFGKWYGSGLPLIAQHLDKIILEQCRGIWCMELADLAGWRGADVEMIKAQITKSKDTARLAYDRFPTTTDRQFILVGTTNPVEFLKDTRNRRFPVLSVERKIDLDGLRRDRDQLWGEAAAESEKMGDSVILPEALWEEAEAHSAQHRVLSPFEEWATDWLEDEGWPDWVTAEKVRKEMPDGTHNAEVGRVMNHFGYKRGQRRINGKKRRTWNRQVSSTSVDTS